MVVFIIISVVLFAIMVILINFDKVKKILPKKKSKKKTETSKPEKKEKYADNMSYSEYQPVKVDNLKNDETFEVSTLDELNEQEEKEKQSQTKSKSKGGRLKGDIKSVEIERVEVEDLGEYDENAGFDDADDNDKIIKDFDNFGPPNKSISQEIKELSPQLKALLIDNVLKRKDDND